MDQMNKSDINAIKSRLGSISPTAMGKLPQAVQRLLTYDIIKLMNMVESADANIPKYTYKFDSKQGISPQ